jgi:hypothetical protein
MAILFSPGGAPLVLCSKSRVRAARTCRPRGPTKTPRCIGGPVPPTEEERIQGGVDSRNEGEKNVEISNYVTSPPSENSQHLTDFQGTLEPARDFGLERRGIAAVYAGELTIEEAR